MRKSTGKNVQNTTFDGTLKDYHVNTIKLPLQVLDDIKNECESWEKGAYATSNKELYRILGRCLALYYDMNGMGQGKINTRKQLNEKLEEAKIRFTEGTSLITKIVRFVFKTDRKRSYNYTRVLDVAIRHRIDSGSLPKWIAEQGGIEEVRRSINGISPAEQKSKLVVKGEVYLTGSPRIGQPIQITDDLQPSNEGNYNFCAALIRANSNGTSEIVFSSTNQTTIKDLLAQAGRKFSDKLANGQNDKLDKDRQDKREEAIKQAV
jgi:hypothetical protein